MSKMQAEITASEVIAYSEKVERAVQRMLRNGKSETEIIFMADSSGPCSTGSNCVFSRKGGNITPPTIDNVTFAYASEFDWLPLSNNVQGIGTSKWEIFMVANVPKEVCIAINKKLGLSVDPIASDTNPMNDLIAYPSKHYACYSSGMNEFRYYHVLIAR